MNNFPPRKIVNKIKQEYPNGTQITLIQMDDPYTKLKSGDKGIVDHVDDIGIIHIKWDCGSSLGVVYDVDMIEKIKGE